MELEKQQLETEVGRYKKNRRANKVYKLLGMPTDEQMHPVQKRRMEREQRRRQRWEAAREEGESDKCDYNDSVASAWSDASRCSTFLSRGPDSMFDSADDMYLASGSSGASTPAARPISRPIIKRKDYGSNTGLADIGRHRMRKLPRPTEQLLEPSDLLPAPIVVPPKKKPNMFTHCLLAPWRKLRDFFRRRKNRVVKLAAPKAAAPIASTHRIERPLTPPVLCASGPRPTIASFPSQASRPAPPPPQLSPTKSQESLPSPPPPPVAPATAF